MDVCPHLKLLLLPQHLAVFLLTSVLFVSPLLCLAAWPFSFFPSFSSLFVHATCLCQRRSAEPEVSLLPSLTVSRLSCVLSAGEVLFQMAEVHRQIQIQLEEMVSMWRRRRRRRRRS